MQDQPLWTPSAVRQSRSNLTAFTQALRLQWGVDLPDYAALHRFSIDQMEKFWLTFWDFAGIRAETRGDRVLIDGDKMPGARFFPDARLNFAENLLRRRDSSAALLFWAEDKKRPPMAWRDLYNQVSRLAQALQDEGVKPGDRVAGFVPNMPETVVAMLATTAIGAVWTSCSPDFGVSGVLDRFGQTKPVVLFAADGYHYHGKSTGSLVRLREINAELESVRKVVIFPLLERNPEVGDILGAETLEHFIADYEPQASIPFASLPFDHPLCIMYSSGTTGMPKCIVHSAGGVLLNQMKEHLLHCDIKAGDRVFYFSTCGWMMWNWLVTALASEAALMLYDGSSFYPNAEVLFDYAQQEQCAFFGVSAKYIDRLRKKRAQPYRTHDLSSLRVIASTGSPLSPESFDFVHQSIKADVHLTSISGGTDILGCFMGGVPTRPVWRGELQGACLGMDVDVFDDDGRPLPAGEKGDLVCRKPFPSMPVGFWSDSDGQRYHKAYFARYPGVWSHSDFISRTVHEGYIVHGRSDATLNPGGVRIGTAEIYRQIERFAQVEEALVIGQEWRDTIRVVLFVKLVEDAALDDSLAQAIRTQIRQHCTTWHVPAKIIAVADIPHTRSGKITELAVRDVVHGQPVRNLEALANPEALDLYRKLPELQD